MARMIDAYDDQNECTSEPLEVLNFQAILSRFKTTEPQSAKKGMRLKAENPWTKSNVISAAIDFRFAKRNQASPNSNAKASFSDHFIGRAGFLFSALTPHRAGQHDFDSQQRCVNTLYI